jgi:hypothetical protein
MNWAQSGATSITFCRSHESVRLVSATSGLFLAIGLPLVCKQLRASQRDVAVRAVTPSGNNHHIRHSRNMLLGMPQGVKRVFRFSSMRFTWSANSIQPLTWPFVSVGAENPVHACGQLICAGRHQRVLFHHLWTEAPGPDKTFVDLTAAVCEVPVTAGTQDFSGSPTRTCRPRL